MQAPVCPQKIGIPSIDICNFYVNELNLKFFTLKRIFSEDLWVRYTNPDLLHVRE
jgi:hypothetical protein